MGVVCDTQWFTMGQSHETKHHHSHYIISQCGGAHRHAAVALHLHRQRPAPRAYDAVDRWGGHHGGIDSFNCILRVLRSKFTGHLGQEIFAIEV